MDRAPGIELWHTPLVARPKLPAGAAASTGHQCFRRADPHA